MKRLRAGFMAKSNQAESTRRPVWCFKCSGGERGTAGHTGFGRGVTEAQTLKAREEDARDPADLLDGRPARHRVVGDVAVPDLADLALLSVGGVFAHGDTPS
ncbi:hypothetical protein AB0F88_43245 [Streptosporangium sp. NPDC023963]|uniref:hypothetical protein n=1 Tax=Streptosporangium sp. NPDC023963 TaxID=3155608 RepID=UPI00341C258F